MCPFSVTLQHVPDRELGRLLIELAQAGFHNPIITPVDAGNASGKEAAVARGPMTDRRLLRERGGRGLPMAGGALVTVPACSWARPARRARFTSDLARRCARTDGDATANASSPSGAVDLRSNRWSSLSQQTTTRRRASCIRACIVGDGGRRMYTRATRFPRSTGKRCELRCTASASSIGRLNKVVVVAREDDDTTILNHALIQGRRRFPT